MDRRTEMAHPSAMQAAPALSACAHMASKLHLWALALFFGYYLLVELPSPVFVSHSSGVFGLVSVSLSCFIQAPSWSLVPRPALAWMPRSPWLPKVRHSPFMRRVSSLSAGFTVFAGVRKEKDGTGVLMECNSHHKEDVCARVIPILLDVTQQETIDSCFDGVQKWVNEWQEPFVGLVNNAGIAFTGVVEASTLSQYRDGCHLVNVRTRLTLCSV
jgi:hypothetical protein